MVGNCDKIYVVNVQQVNNSATGSPGSYREFGIAAAVKPIFLSVDFCYLIDAVTAFFHLAFFKYLLHVVSIDIAQEKANSSCQLMVVQAGILPAGCRHQRKKSIYALSFIFAEYYSRQSLLLSSNQSFSACSNVHLNLYPLFFNLAPQIFVEI